MTTFSLNNRRDVETQYLVVFNQLHYGCCAAGATREALRAELHMLKLAKRRLARKAAAKGGR